ncbi:unnamed protein product [Adineta ricciae]|uniref:Nuclear receptor domain-containing protein n=1 Tax=Adineta ricciae TaxID=249248 RepID=A0A814NFF4_ADIRI|nr:unnamed protein product [Adineta ricciae]
MNQIQKTKPLSKHCQICGAPAQYSYFGVVSCHSCKMFFKRNGNSKKDMLKCDYNNNCEINLHTRHLCTACRLAKCFRFGMTTDRFRPSRQMKPTTNGLVNTRISTLNLVQSDNSLLTPSQWTLLSNLYHSYNESELIVNGHRLADLYIKNKPFHMADSTCVKEFLTSIYQTAGKYLCSNGDIGKLSVDDRSLILRGAADNVACITGVFCMNHCRLYNLDSFLHMMTLKYGEKTVSIHQRGKKYIDSDIVIGKLAISLFALTQHTSIHLSNVLTNLINPVILLQIQNSYAEVTWKYLVYRYGLFEAVRRFLNLTLWLRAVTMLTHHAQTLTAHVYDVDTIVDDVEFKLLLDDIDQMAS